MQHQQEPRKAMKMQRRKEREFRERIEKEKGINIWLWQEFW
jgi:hypothetical protein